VTIPVTHASELRAHRCFRHDPDHAFTGAQKHRLTGRNTRVNGHQIDTQQRLHRTLGDKRPGVRISPARRSDQGVSPVGEPLVRL
jgi:hypothetical protein